MAVTFIHKEHTIPIVKTLICDGISITYDVPFGKRNIVEQDINNMPWSPKGN